MTDPRTATQELQAQFLDSVRKSQEAMVDALRAWAETVHSVTPALPVSAVPFADKLPNPSELVADAFDFAEQLLVAQRKFAEDVIQITAPAAAGEAPATAKKTAGTKLPDGFRRSPISPVKYPASSWPQARSLAEVLKAA